MALNMKVEILGPDGQPTEERRIPKCYPYQIPNLPANTSDLRISWLDENGKTQPNTVHNYRVGTRKDVIELLNVNNKLGVFADNTETDPADSRYIVALDQEFDTRRITSK